MKTLREILNEKDNNYILKESSVPQIKSVSVVVPFLGNIDLVTQTVVSLFKQKIPTDIKTYEIVLVNDGSGSLQAYFEGIFNSHPFSKAALKYIELKANLGRSIARNIGLVHSIGELVILLDGDMIAPDTFVKAHIEINNQNEHAVVIGVNKDYLGKRKTFLEERGADKLYGESINDFRVERKIPEEWKPSYPEAAPDNFGKVCHPIKDTDRFRRFGKGRICGVWSLPFMFLSGNVSTRKKYLLQVGGFSEQFKGWGLEDTHLGAKLIGAGLYFIPLDKSMPVHRKTPKDELGNRFTDFGRNLELYNKLLDFAAVKIDEPELYEYININYSKLLEVHSFAKS